VQLARPFFCMLEVHPEDARVRAGRRAGWSRSAREACEVSYARRGDWLHFGGRLSEGSRGSARVREKLLQLQEGQQVRVQVSGLYRDRRGCRRLVGWSSLDVRMLESLAPLRYKEESVVVVLGRVRTIGKRGGLRLAGGISLSSSVASVDVTSVEVVG
jgi:hypothetical protein